MEELLAEAERIVEKAPAEVGIEETIIYRNSHLQLVGNLVETGAPMGPDVGSWFSVLANLGTNYDTVVPFGPYLKDSDDLETLDFSLGFVENLPWLAMFVMFAKVILVFFVSPVLLLLLTWKMLRQ